jgi:flavin-dependent dehydrogenase
VLLAGDAAGMADPLFGEGIPYAVRTGALAARAALHGLDVSLDVGVDAGADAARARYLRDIAANVLPEFRAVSRLRVLFYCCEKLLGPTLLKALLQGGGGVLLEAVHGVRSFRLLRRVEQDRSGPLRA